MRTLLSFLISLTLVASGCNRINIADYSTYVGMPTDGMPTDMNFELAPESIDTILDLTKPYDVIVAVRYTNSCPSKNVIFNIEEFSLNQECPDSLRMELSLFNNEGRPIGKNMYGIIEITDTLHKDFRIPQGYSFSLSSPLPPSSTIGIKAIGLIFVDHNKPKYYTK